MSNLRVLPSRNIRIDGLNLTASSRELNFLILGKRNCGRASIMRKVAQDLLDHGEKVLYFGQLANVINPGFFNETRDLFYDHEMAGGVDWRGGKGSFSCTEWVRSEQGGALFVFGDLIAGNDPAAAFLEAMLLALCRRESHGRHVYVFIEDLHQLPRLKGLLPALTLGEMCGFSTWISAPSSFLIRDTYGEGGVRKIADDCPGVIATLIDLDTAEFVRTAYGNEMAGLDELPPGKGAVYIRHRDSIEIQEVAVG